MSAQEIKDLAQAYAATAYTTGRTDLGGITPHLGAKNEKDTLHAAIDAQAAEIARLKEDLREADRQFHALEDQANANAEHASFYRWLRDEYSEVKHWQVFAVLTAGPMHQLDTAIRAAMKGGT